jgi:hypothetical protein
MNAKESTFRKAVSISLNHRIGFPVKRHKITAKLAFPSPQASLSTPLSPLSPEITNNKEVIKKKHGPVLRNAKILDRGVRLPT